MKYGKAALALGLFAATPFVPAPANALNVVAVDDGDACRIEVAGDSLCRWQRGDGPWDTPVSLELGRGGAPLLYFIDVGSAPDHGRIEIRLPYSFDWNDGPAMYQEVGVTGTTSNRPVAPTDRFSFVSRFSGALCEPGDPFCGEETADPATFHADGFYTMLIGGYQIIEGGLWTAAIDWSFQPGVTLHSLQIYGTIDTPEPALWATFIAGFGLVGAALRRQRRARRA